jgi:hypothetical protein
MISRIDEQPTPIDKPLFRSRNFFKDRRNGRDRRRGSTIIDPALDRRKRERRKYRTQKEKNA